MAMNLAQMQRRIEALEAISSSVLRFGTIVGVDEKSGSARVQLGDADNMVSYPLRVLQSRTLKDQHQEMPDLGEHVACLFSGQGLEQGLMLGAVYTRLLHSFGVDTQVQLARCLGIRQSSISDAKRRSRIPDGWLVAALMQKAVNPTWLLHGHGSQYLTPSDGKPFITPINGNMSFSSVEELICELFRLLPGCKIRITDAQGKAL